MNIGIGDKNNSLCWRPYRVECTGSLPTSEVKRRRARLVLGWGTAREVLRVLTAFARVEDDFARVASVRLHGLSCVLDVFMSIRPSQGYLLVMVLSHASGSSYTYLLISSFSATIRLFSFFFVLFVSHVFGCFLLFRDRVLCTPVGFPSGIIR